ncbi:Hypothetical protein PHPALM_14367 [Phytophthora palmivora]|uniref:Uncharacterized protein n=1 Tax=Phytophthora palmivora TaxID=4796 RepID=A0A2P4XUW1_9STRA|nr:Hypothetical protein PHPALM_14367 [Phytophthora palmivora]
MYLDESPVPRKKRRCRNSKKKRLRLKKRASLEPKIEGKGDESPFSINDLKQIQEHTQRHVKTQDYNKEQRHQDQKQAETIQCLSQKESETQVETHILDDEQDVCNNGDDLMGAEEEEMTEYERRRRANILRNQAFMKKVGMSIAKLATRTTIGNEAEKDAKRKQLADKREKRAIQAAKMPKPAQRLSLRIQMKPYSENVRARARMMASRGVEVSLPAVVGRDIETKRSERSDKEKETKESSHKHANTVAKNDTRRQELGEFQPVRRDAFVHRISRTAHKTETKKVNITSTDSPPTEPNSFQKLEAKKSINQDEVQGHHVKKIEHDKDTGYECKRQQNIARNQAPMQIGFTTNPSLRKQEAEKEIKRQALTANRVLLKPAQDTILRRPIRKSRQRGHEIEVNLLDRGHPLDLLSLKTGRQRYGNKVHFMDAMDDEGKSFLEHFTSDFHASLSLEKKTSRADCDSIDYSLAKRDVVKTMSEPIRAMAFLPRADRIVVASGDKEGHIALWSPSNKDGSDSSVVLYRPHGFAVSQLVFPDAARLISSSYDGTVREFDLWTSKLSVVCDAGFGISAVAASMNPQFFYAGCDDGTLRLIDRRARTLDRSGYPLHEARINTLDQHPVLNYCIATASLDNTVCFWDKRKISSEANLPVVTLPHADNVGCAYFSPRDGEWLVTVSQDSYINIFDTSIISERNDSDPLPIQLPNPIRTQHNNSISSSGSKFMLHAAWDPKTTNKFVIGCMEKPPRIQIFNAGNCSTVRELTSSNFDSSHPVNVFHPYLDLIASGNSTGRIALWRG